MVKSESFSSWVKQYCEVKEEEKLLKGTISKLSEDIKATLAESKDKKEQVGEWEVCLQHKITESLDEEKLINSILQYWEDKDTTCPYIKYIPVIDMEALEGAVYREELPDEIIESIDKCRIKKESDALVYKKVKNKEDN